MVIVIATTYLVSITTIGIPHGYCFCHQKHVLARDYFIVVFISQRNIHTIQYRNGGEDYLFSEYSVRRNRLS